MFCSIIVRIIIVDDDVLVSYVTVIYRIELPFLNWRWRGASNFVRTEQFFALWVEEGGPKPWVVMHAAET